MRAKRRLAVLATTPAAFAAVVPPPQLGVGHRPQDSRHPALDAIALPDTGAPGRTGDDRRRMTEWNKDFLDRLKESDFGKQEGAAVNNHGTVQDTQFATLAYATGDRRPARSTVRAATGGRITAQIAGDGRQPQELTRTRSWHYSTFTLVAHTRLAAIAVSW
ncbi:hypothetical protein GCM10023220_60120 [Streptomyces ziwulingensis]|uniref:Alginate lyase domain-containing protein n=1 Tax=Streptomyces ziwulingensis TaxID=1045501 RepID=A0ABP9CWM5_9ACTN